MGAESVVDRPRSSPRTDRECRRVLILSGQAFSLLNFRGPLIQDLRERGHEVVACTPQDAHTEGLRRRVEGGGVRLETVPLKRRSLTPFYDFRTIRALTALFQRLRPDRVLAYMAKPIVYGGLAARRAGNTHFVPMFTGLGCAFGGRHTLRALFAERAYLTLYRCALGSAAAVIFQNPEDRNLFRARRLVPPSTPTLRVHGSGVDLMRFRETPLPRQPVFLMLSRLLASKGVREYVGAAEIVRRSFPGARFQLAGPMEQGVEAVAAREVERWVAEGRVEYLGRLEDVRPALANARFVVLPSYYREGVPRSLLEALAVGRPVITTDTPGCRETVDDGRNGRLVAPRSAEALAGSMLELLQVPDADTKAMGRASRRLAETRYDVRAVNQEIIRALAL